MTDLQTVCAALLDAAAKAGARDADAMASRGDSLSVEVRGGALEHAERAEAVEIGLRVILDGRQAVASASDAKPATIAMLAERAVAMAKEAPDDPDCGLADPGQLIRDWDVAALKMDDGAPAPAPDALRDAGLAAEDAMLAVPGVSQSESCGASWYRSETHIAQSNGFSGGYARSGHSLFASAIVGEGLGMERDGRYESRRALAELPDPAEIGASAAERALARLSPRKPPTGAFPVLFDARVSNSLIGHLIGAINGASVARGASWLKDAMGTEVLPKGFTLREEPHRIAGPASRPFDAEGLAPSARDLVADGVLEGWLLDLASAGKLGLAPTGNATRGVSSAPRPGSGNLRLIAPERSVADLMGDLGTGLLVTSMIGASINPTTGAYSRGASGMWVENGAPVYPVNELTIAGSLPEMLRTLVAGDDGDPHRMAVVPALLVEGLTIAGA